MKTQNFTAMVAIADGTEEIEAVTIIDVLRRAGTNVTVAAVDHVNITASRDTRITADKLIGDCISETYDLIALPGGMPGAERLRDCTNLIDILRAHNALGKLIGAICAAPAVVLLHHGFLKGTQATCHPSFKERMPENIYCDTLVVESNNIITSQGAGTAMMFALKLVERLHGSDILKQVEQGLIIFE